jgi:acetyl-CoA acetyltransferase
MSTRSARDRPCIVGIGQTEFTRRGGIVDRSELRLAAEAAIAAAADAGLPCREIDGFAAAFSLADARSLLSLLEVLTGLAARLAADNIDVGQNRRLFAAAAEPLITDRPTTERDRTRLQRR